MAQLQDIHLTDVDLWTNFQTYWNAGNYALALSLLENNTQLATKYINANWVNNTTDSIVALENTSDPTFKQDRIQVASTAPSLSTGEIYFQLD